MELRFSQLAEELVMALPVDQVVEQLMDLQEEQEIRLQLLLHKAITAGFALTLVQTWLVVEAVVLAVLEEMARTAVGLPVLVELVQALFQSGAQQHHLVKT
jgi:hypothetical protein